VGAPGYGNPVSGGVSGEAQGAASGYATGGPVGAVVGGALGTAAGAVSGTANMLTPPPLRCNAGYAYYNGACVPAPVGCERRSVRVADKDKGCAGHDRGARADEGDVGAFDLT
jgi:hypothetical protein